MDHSTLESLVAILGLGVGAQWLAWKLRLPSILLLLLAGIVAGPATQFLRPDRLFGELLEPLVSLSVSLILFEGGLTLSFTEVKKTGKVVIRLVTCGALVTWGILSAAGFFILGLDARLALLLGAILIVTGPTVIGPLLLYLKPTGQAGPILKWESILIDPLGAMLAVLIFEAISVSTFQAATSFIIVGILQTLAVGLGAGLSAAFFLAEVIKRHWVPDELLNPVTLMFVVFCFAAANALQVESGLLAVTVMGIALANWKGIVTRHILAFKGILRTLLISSLFVLLAARLQRAHLSYLNIKLLDFLGVSLFVARPLAVALSTYGAKLRLEEKILIGWMAPRGIVAAAVASVFAMRLRETGFPEADTLVTITFFMILATVVIYGLTASPLARALKLASPNPQGILFVGAHKFSREAAKVLQREGYRVLLADTNWSNVQQARMEGLPTYYGNLLWERARYEIDLGGIGKLLAITPNDNINSLIALHLSDIFDRSEIYQLPPQKRSGSEEKKISPTLRGRFLFGETMTFQELSRRLASGYTVKKTVLSKAFDAERYHKLYGDDFVPLFALQERKLLVFTSDGSIRLKPCQAVISLVKEKEGDTRN